MGLRKGKAAPVDPWRLDGSGEERRKDIPLEGKAERRAARTRAYVKFAAYALPFALGMFGLGLVSAVTGIGPDAAQNSEQTATADIPGRSVALAEFDKWLAAEPSPLPGATLAGWVGASRSVPIDATVRDQGMTEWVHEVAIVLDGDVYRGQISVGIDKDEVAHVLSFPSVEPIEAGQKESQAWQGVIGAEGTSASDIASAVQAWAEAYWSADPVKVRQATGDPDATKVYQAMPKANVTAEVAAVSVLDAKDPSRAVARVRVAADWEGEGGASVYGDAKPAGAFEYDLLVEGADGGSPRVVAWGGPGTGPSLEKHGNGRESADEMEG